MMKMSLRNEPRSNCPMQELTWEAKTNTTTNFITVINQIGKLLHSGDAVVKLTRNLTISNMRLGNSIGPKEAPLLSDKVISVLLLFVLALPFRVFAEGSPYSVAKSITRIQGRTSVGGDHIEGYTFSSFILTENKTFSLLILDYEKNKDRAISNGLFEYNVGHSMLNGPFGWVLRFRSYYRSSSVGAAGLQLNFNAINAFAPFLKDARLQTFVQLLGNTQDPYFGNYEILHYYNFDVAPKQFSIRGYNIVSETHSRSGTVRNSWADAIYSFNKSFDIYFRINYVSRDNEYLGLKGTTRFVGLRASW